MTKRQIFNGRQKLGISRKLKTEMHKQLKIRTDMNSDAPVHMSLQFELH